MFDSLMVFLKDFFLNANFEDYKKHAKLTNMQKELINPRSLCYQIMIKMQSVVLFLSALKTFCDNELVQRLKTVFYGLDVIKPYYFDNCTYFCG